MNLQAMIMSIAGSLIIQFLNLAELSRVPKSRRPDFKDGVFWLPFIIHPATAALISYAYFDEFQEVNKMLAIQLGASAPLIMKTVANAIPKGVVNIDT